MHAVSHPSAHDAHTRLHSQLSQYGSHHSRMRAVAGFRNASISCPLLIIGRTRWIHGAFIVQPRPCMDHCCNNNNNNNNKILPFDWTSHAMSFLMCMIRLGLRCPHRHQSLHPITTPFSPARSAHLPAVVRVCCCLGRWFCKAIASCPTQASCLAKQGRPSEFEINAPDPHAKNPHVQLLKCGSQVPACDAEGCLEADPGLDCRQLWDCMHMLVLVVLSTRLLLLEHALNRCLGRVVQCEHEKMRCMARL